MFTEEVVHAYVSLQRQLGVFKSAYTSSDSPIAIAVAASKTLWLHLKASQLALETTDTRFPVSMRKPQGNYSDLLLVVNTTCSHVLTCYIRYQCKSHPKQAIASSYGCGPHSITQYQVLYIVMSEVRNEGRCISSQGDWEVQSNVLAQQNGRCRSVLARASVDKWGVRMRQYLRSLSLSEGSFRANCKKIFQNSASMRPSTTDHIGQQIPCIMYL